MQRNRGRARLITLLVLTAGLVTSPFGTPAEAGGGVKVVTVKGGLNGPSAFTFAPNGDIWYLERGTGRVRVLTPSTGQDRVFHRIGHVNGTGERGALGIALHPAWPAKPFVFVYVTRSINGRLRNQLLRLKKVGAHAGGVRILVSIVASSSPYHNGGRLLVGPDHKLYLVVGDAHEAVNAQRLRNNLRGKILRLDPNGTAAPNNPHGRVWAFGIRNSYGFDFDPRTGRLWETDNGPECNDEINRIVRNGNYAWGPHENCGSLPKPRDTNRDGPSPRRLPKEWFASPIGITGIAFCQRCGLGAAFNGRMLYGCVNDGRIRVSRLNADRTAIVGSPAFVVHSPHGAVHSMEVGPNHRIYFSDGSGIYRLAPA
jgi:glucose/arabinose dehydrogenase